MIKLHLRCVMLPIEFLLLQKPPLYSKYLYLYFFFFFWDLSLINFILTKKHLFTIRFHPPSFCFHQFIAAFLLMWCLSRSIAIHCLICAYATFGFQLLYVVESRKVTGDWMWFFYYHVCFHKNYSHIWWWLLFGNQAKSSHFSKMSRIENTHALVHRLLFAFHLYPRTQTVDCWLIIDLLLLAFHNS